MFCLFNILESRQKLVNYATCHRHPLNQNLLAFWIYYLIETGLMVSFYLYHLTFSFLYLKNRFRRYLSIFHHTVACIHFVWLVYHLYFISIRWGFFQIKILFWVYLQSEESNFLLQVTGVSIALALLSLLITFSVGTVALGTDAIVILLVFKFYSVSMNFYQLMPVGWFSFLQWFSLGL